MPIIPKGLVDGVPRFARLIAKHLTLGGPTLAGPGVFGTLYDAIVLRKAFSV